MSKKKRHRRPPTAQPGIVAAPLNVTQDTVDAAEPDAIDATDAAVEESAAPVVDVALAQAVAMAQAGPMPDESQAPAPRFDPAPQAGPQAGWDNDGSGDIRGVLIQVAGGRLLLPNATIAEVLSYAEPENDGAGVDWLLGRFRWRGWQIPLVAFSRLAGIGEDKPGLGTKVIVLKALGGDRRIPFFAIVTQGFPRLVTVSHDSLIESAGEGDEQPPGVLMPVLLRDDPAVVPDLAQIEQRLADALAAA